MTTFDRRVAWTTLLVGMISLGHELLLVRMLAFFVGNSMDILAIPIALLGLALGSMLRHFVIRGDADAVMAWSARAVLPLMAAGFAAFFFVANTWYPQIHVALATPASEAGKVVVYALLSLPVYAAVGVLFSTLFDRYAAHVGSLYFWDLAGAALGCVLVPLLLTNVGLVPALLALHVAALGLFLLQRGPDGWEGRAAWLDGAAVALVLGLGLGAQALFQERPDPRILGRSILGPWNADRIVEVDARWNELARTSLLRAEWNDRGRAPVYAIVQDNGLSNVTVDPYVPDRFRPDAFKRVLFYGLPWHLGLDPTRILVMFAGQGRDMLAFQEITRGQADIVGVEINRTVVGWAEHPALTQHLLPQFHGLPNVHLVNAEGRDFLNHDTRTYDLIYVANNGAVAASRTGHTRKFLDTREAMEAYLERLAPDGMMVFVVQPVWDKIPALRDLLRERGISLRDAAYVFGDPAIATMDTMILKPTGFTPGDLKTLDELVRTHRASILHRPGGPTDPRITRDFQAVVSVTDDHPFTRPIGWSTFGLLPDPERYHDAAYVSGWVKAFTVVLFGGVALLIGGIAAGVGRPEQRVPAVWVGYLLLSGIGYMAVEIPLIAKAELLVGNPLYAVSINLAVFLIANAVGARLHDVRGFLPNPWALGGAVIAAVAWGLLAASVANATMLSLPLPIKALGVAVAVFPAGVVLGAFYPYCVGRLAGSGHGGAVPMTYGLTTLSSVFGSAAAMTAIVDLGFTPVILVGALAYLGACALVLRGT